MPKGVMAEDGVTNSEDRWGAERERKNQDRFGARRKDTSPRTCLGKCAEIVVESRAFLMMYPSRLGLCKRRWRVRYESSDLGDRPGIGGGKRRSVARSGHGSPSAVLSPEWFDRQRPFPRVGGSVPVFPVGSDCRGSHSSGCGGSRR
jgi:hypothetical protein